MDGKVRKIGVVLASAILVATIGATTVSCVRADIQDAEIGQAPGSPAAEKQGIPIIIKEPIITKDPKKK